MLRYSNSTDFCFRYSLNYALTFNDNGFQYARVCVWLSNSIRKACLKFSTQFAVEASHRLQSLGVKLSLLHSISLLILQYDTIMQYLFHFYSTIPTLSPYRTYFLIWNSYIAHVDPSNASDNAGSYWC